mmetsp:Transcript_12210/g.10827  ORF Transcript_12210/g.10827 Transcript_12210/m.10827 type:complete len:120 (-) Transcript_12210:185-544(-)
MEVVRGHYDNRPIGIHFISPSFNTFAGNNPSFRVFKLDSQTKLPLEVETYYFNLEKANRDDSFAHFEQLHKLTEEYNLKDLRPSEILQLASNLMIDEQLAIKYLKNHRAQGKPSKTISE